MATPPGWHKICGTAEIKTACVDMRAYGLSYDPKVCGVVLKGLLCSEAQGAVSDLVCRGDVGWFYGCQRADTPRRSPHRMANSVVRRGFHVCRGMEAAKLWGAEASAISPTTLSVALQRPSLGFLLLFFIFPFLSDWGIVKSGNHKNWGGCRCIRCPWHWMLSHVSHDGPSVAEPLGLQACTGG